MKATTFYGVLPTNRPPAPRAVALRSAPPYRPAPFRHRPSPLIADPSPRMGNSFSFDAVPGSVALAGAGVGTLFLSGVLPAPIDTFGKVAGIGLLTFAFLNLFSGTAQAEGAATEDRRFPMASQEAFNLVRANIIEPKRDSDVSRGLFSSDYDVIVRWVNPSDERVSITYDIAVEEQAHNLLFPNPETWKGIVYSGVVNLGAGEEALVPLELDLKTPTVGAPAFTQINLQLRKYSQAGQPIIAATSRFVVR